ncbi:carbon-monoxide dehydrogenase medium subunit [Lentzea pudingi]|uniref:Carbon-monoxide dehydrogenase medium subunit n=1 Tax=Lentzea pudingi TaxID=1789439 RepID=A0ABQ2ISZ9_9PSEU|nr:FAD binding domain-containing protein [Lentzea pudingi]GGN28599.1 carbon-monoxide dehydrogenase medium subunit [Lentzea pudingi]
MRDDILAPSHVVDIGRVADVDHFDTSGPTLRFGALAKMADVAEDPALRADYPALAESLRLAASQQLRNTATIGGNVLQRTRCPYYRDGTSACNKRAPGSGCSAIDGVNRDHAVLGGSESCAAVYPGDLGVALIAFDAQGELASATGPRTLRFADLHRDVADRPDRETNLQPGEITAVTVPASPTGRRSAYVKVRDRASYAFAVASTAVVLEIEGGVVTAARVGLGGVATRPWRSPVAEAELVGRPLTPESTRAAGQAAFATAVPRRDNAVKTALEPRVVERACLLAHSRGESR